MNSQLIRAIPLILGLAGLLSASGCAFVIVGGDINSDEAVQKAMRHAGGTNGAGNDHSLGARTFFVVPTKLPNGAPADAQRTALEAWLVERAGGYTCLGPVVGAWRDGAGSVVTEDNVAYLVTIDEDAGEFAEEVEERIIDSFEQEEAYVEQW